MTLLVALTGFVAASATLKSLATGGPLTRRSLATSDTACATELVACSEDTSCVACTQVFADAYAACQADAERTSQELYVECSEGQEIYCCSLADEAEECYNDAAFANYIECLFEEGNPTCTNTVDISDCNGAIGRATAWGLPSTLVSAAVGALLVAAFGSSVV